MLVAAGFLMSEYVTKSVRNFEEIEKGSQNSYQSVWMSRWTRTDFDAMEPRFSAGENENSSRHPRGLNKIHIASDISGPSKQFEEIKPLRTLEIMKQSVSGGNMKNGQSYQPSSVNNSSVQSLSRLQKDKETRGSRSSQSSSTLQEGKEMRGMQPFTPLVDTVAQTHEVKQRTTSSCIPYSAAAATEVSCRQSKSQESIEKMKLHAFFGENSYAESRPLHNISGSASGIILYRSGSGKKIFEFERSAMSSYMGSHFVHANDQLLSSDINQSEADPYHCRMHSTNLLGTTSIKNHTTSVKSSTPYRRLDSLKDPSISANICLPVSRDNHLRLQNFPGFKRKQFSSHCNSSELTKLEKFHHGYSSMRDLPPLVPRVETLRICANVDSVAGLSGWFPRLSHNTHVNFGNEDGIKNVRVASDIDVNAYLSSSSPFLRHGQQGVKIRSLGSSTDSEGNKNHENSKDSEGNLKNTSSAETDVMDMDAFTEKCHTSGVNQSSLMKALNTSTMQFSGDRSRTEIGNSHINKELPDINLELSAENNAIEGAVPSSSKTQSLDMDMLAAYPAQTNISVSGPSLNILLKTDATERWAKRLKSCASDTEGVGTPSFDLEDVLRKKLKRPSGMLTSELGRGSNHMEILAVADKTETFQRNSFTSTRDATKRGKDVLLSQSWIQRWLRNQAGTPEKQPGAVVLCEPESSKLVLDDPQKKQFPSIAAMALMGKAMNGFQPCELQNRGSFVVWN